MENKEVGVHVFVFNPKDNGGEQLSLTTHIMDNGDPSNNIYLNQELRLGSYCNAAAFILSGAPINPDDLRRLANELERELNKHRR